ncbi:MAG: histidinol dehydrogenase, partial [Pirellulaceae bacterium]|nr:histidinol dehydrogenase [Pirellulaceae bacterium]
MPELNIQRIDTRSDDIQTTLASLRAKLSPAGNVVSERGRQKTTQVFGEPLTPAQVVEQICSDVKEFGLDAVLRYTHQLDDIEIDGPSLRVSQQRLQEAHAAAKPEFLETVRRIRDNILEFQQAILHQDIEVTRPLGVSLHQRYTPLRRVGICVPGGAAAYPSTVLMTAVPAFAAGVSEVAVVAPPNDFGAHNGDVLATCHEVGISEVYRVGGAQAVAALAYGVEGLPAVDKIVGPGNLFVALAKKLVYGEVDIDSIAGPSEVVVIADDTTRPEFTAADLLAQAEHAPGASILLTWSEDMLQQTAAQLDQQIGSLSRSELTRQSLEDFGALVLVRDPTEACEIANLIAPEHLHLAVANPHPLLKQISHAGATFLGNFSPVALGDYAAGPSHVLPTGGTARWAAGLTANEFLRGSSVISYSQKGLEAVAHDIQVMADKEGLTAHRASVDIRLS